MCPGSGCGWDAVGVTEDPHPLLDRHPDYCHIFNDELPDSLHAWLTDPSPANQVRAAATYNHIVEGTLALTGYYAWYKVCSHKGILPGMQELVKRIGDDERRHMAWGTFTCRRHVAADDSNWEVCESRIDELLLPSVGFSPSCSPRSVTTFRSASRWTSSPTWPPTRQTVGWERSRVPADARRRNRPRLCAAGAGGQVRRRGREEPGRRLRFGWANGRPAALCVKPAGR
jgi:hypothetical protein